MRSKPVALLAIALGCGGMAAFAATQVIQNQGAPVAGAEMVEILVAVKDMAINTKITTDRFQLEKWPRDRVPNGAIADPKLVEGKFTNQRLYQGEPLLERKINTSRETVAQTIPAGSKVFDLPVDKHNGGTGYIHPGDRVDVHGFFEKGGRVAESKSVLVMEDVEVFMVDGIAIREEEASSSKQASVIQLLVKANQYEALNTAANLGKLKLSLTPPRSEDESYEQDNGEKFLEWVKTAVVEENPTFGSMPAVVPTPAPSRGQKRRILIFSPSGSETYEVDPNSSVPPQKLTSENDDSNYQSDQLVSGVDQQQSPNPQSPPKGMIWDGTHWTWGGSGFKPAYPNADDDKTGRATNDAKSDNSN